MTPALREAVVDELPLPLPAVTAAAEAIGIAIALEEAFDIVLGDDEIDAAHLGTRAAVLRVLDHHLGAG